MISKAIKYILVSFIFLVGCINEETKEDIEPKTIEVETNEIFPLDNPVLFMGSSFGEFYQTLHKLGKYKEMLVYTSLETKSKFSDEELLHFFKNMKFSYPIKLKSMSTDDQNTLFYETQIEATIKTIQIEIRIENDTCRVHFDQLNTEKPFIGI